MPTILTIFGWRFFFYANERNEPIYIHFDYIASEWNRFQEMVDG